MKAINKRTESFHNYKGYIIKLTAIQNNGFWYNIIKQYPNPTSPNGLKNIRLREIGFNFIKPEAMLQKAKDYIDNYESKLEEKYNKIITNGI